MASPQTVPEQLPVEQAQSELVNGTEKLENGGKEEDASVAVVEDGVKGLALEQDGEFALHQACAQGRVDEVREVLQKGTEKLEVLDSATGCTPIVLAIRNNHPEVVRELLQAGAIVPPPGVTNDQQMLSILYPPHMYGMPPFMHQQHPHHPQQHFQHPQQPEYYPQPPFGFPSTSNNASYMPYAPQPHRQRKESDVGQNQVQPNLPPVEVAKTIPCRNTPNCKYGTGCMFFHPRTAGGLYFGQNQGQPGYGQESQQGFQGFQQGYQQPGGYQHMGMQPEMGQYGQGLPSHAEQVEGKGVEGEEKGENLDTTTMIGESTQDSQPIPARHHMNGMQNGMQAPFIPAFQQGHAQMPMSPVDFNSSISPSMLGNSLPPIPTAEQFFAATSPPPSNGFMGHMAPSFVPMPMGARRQSFGQFGLPGMASNGMPIPVGVNGPGKMNGFGHGKKPSFSGGPRPFGAGNPRADYGKWKDGAPPPCIFFLANKCRNGEMCKFPHIDAEGVDCRHPDIIRGAIQPMPALGLNRPVRPVRQFGNFDPSFKQQQLLFLQQQRAAVQQAAQTTPASTQTNGDMSSSQTLVNGDSSNVNDSETPKSITQLDKGVSTLPPKPITTTSSLAAPALVRSASQPGIQRVHANGFNSRSQSPAPSNTSFHGNGHPKRASSRPGFPPQVNGNAQGPVRSDSADGKTQAGPAAVAKKNQRVPGADEFPALGGMGGESKQASPVARGRTAAEVLSAPAPEKEKVVAPVKPTVERKESMGAGSAKSDDQSIDMDSDNDSDGVVISVKPSSSSNTTAAAAPAPAAKRPTMSFAMMAGGASGTTDNAPIAVKA